MFICHCNACPSKACVCGDCKLEGCACECQLARNCTTKAIKKVLIEHGIIADGQKRTRNELFGLMHSDDDPMSLLREVMQQRQVNAFTKLDEKTIHTIALLGLSPSNQATTKRTSVKDKQNLKRPAKKNATKRAVKAKRAVKSKRAVKGKRPAKFNCAT